MFHDSTETTINMDVVAFCWSGIELLVYVFQDFNAHIFYSLLLKVSTAWVCMKSKGFL